MNYCSNFYLVKYIALLAIPLSIAFIVKDEPNSLVLQTNDPNVALDAKQSCMVDKPTLQSKNKQDVELFPKKDVYFINCGGFF